MSAADKAKHVLTELKCHAPFTLLGAITGIAMMLVFSNMSYQASYRLFYIFHPAHVVLSAMVTASLFRLHEKTKGFLIVLIVGYVGAIGTATLSDSVLPYFGEEIMGVAVPTHAAFHQHDDCEHGHCRRKLHIGFIEEWYIVNPAAILGVVFAYFLPRTRFPHALHILISTWASSAHIMMNNTQPLGFILILGILIVLFIAVWLPCCFSDIIFPTLLVGSDGCTCHFHAHKKHRRDENQAKE